MNQKKVTAKDIAREAGVSVATVSYVMNGRTDQKISDDTKKKILQIANLLNYVPSHAAKSLATGKNNTIGICYLLTGVPTADASLLSFANLLIERLERMKYDVAIIPAKKVEDGLPINRNVDAIIAICLDHADFRLLADNYLVPVICVDMIVNDSLFYQIYEDVPYLIEKALVELPDGNETYFIYDSLGNDEFEEFMLNLPSTIKPLRHRDLSSAMLNSLKDKHIIAMGAFLGLSLIPYIDKSKACFIVSEGDKSLIPDNIPVVLDNTQKKANMTINILLNALDRNFEMTHDHKIR